jgi:hypothetical protein
LKEIGDTDGKKNSVDWPPRPMLSEKREHTLPSTLVRFAVGFLRGIAARGVQEDGFVCKPPVAVSRAPDSANLLGTKSVSEGEGEA